MLFRSDRKSTRLNSSHTLISYAVFCLKKKKQKTRLDNEQNRPPTWTATYARLQIRTIELPLHTPTRSAMMILFTSFFFFFFFNDTATTEIYTLSLHDALPISRLNSSHTLISYAVFWSSDV